MASFSPQDTEGILLPTTDIYDAQLIEALDIESPEFKDFLVRLQETLNTYALYINNKAYGRYNIRETINGKTYFQTTVSSSSSSSYTPRQGYWIVVDVGALLNNATKTVPHNIPGINTNFTFTTMYGAATNPIGLQSIPIPYINTEGFVGIKTTNTDLLITSNFDATAFTRCYIVIEYLKN